MAAEAGSTEAEADMDSNPSSKVETGNQRIIQCQSCGAGFDPSEPKCPYCGTMYEPGAEARYMEHLGDIREDMEDLNSLALSETGSELKLAAKKTLKTLLFIVAAIAALLGICRLIDFLRLYIWFI